MSANPDGTPTPAPAAPPPATPPGDKAGKTYTEDEHKAILRGQGKEIKKLRAQVEAAEKAETERKEAEEAAKRERLEKQGEFKTLAEEATAERDDFKAKYETLAAAETTRQEGVAKSNKARLEALSEEHQALLPPGLGADAAAEQLGRIEAIAGVQTPVTVHGGLHRGGPQQPLSPDDQDEQAHNDLNAKMRKGAGK